jgi:hypothetical protein
MMPMLLFTPSEWEAFVGGVRSDIFDRFTRTSDDVNGAAMLRPGRLPVPGLVAVATLSTAI